VLERRCMGDRGLVLGLTGKVSGFCGFELTSAARQGQPGQAGGGQQPCSASLPNERGLGSPACGVWRHAAPACCLMLPLLLSRFTT
jgi:hypothetical protein